MSFQSIGATDLIYDRASIDFRRFQKWICLEAFCLWDKTRAASNYAKQTELEQNA